VVSLLFDSLGFLITLGILLFFLSAVLSPFETLGWWAGWTKKTLDDDMAGASVSRQYTGNQQLEDSTETLSSPPVHFLVYLRGIATANAELGRREQGFIELLKTKIPAATVISDIFPYSATNNPLTGERAFARLYHWLLNARLRSRNGLFAILFIVRNLMQVAVSGDPRYGPIYNSGIAREIGLQLIQHNYPTGTGHPIWVLGWSGGGQIAIGTARYLHQLFQAPVYVVSIGGVMLDDPGITEIEHLYHLEGSKDNFPRLGDLFSPGRWRFVKHSAWNKALQAARITFINPGPMRHTGKDDYFDFKAQLPNGQNHAEHTAQVVVDIVTSNGDRRVSE
jgi:pimeloyl-ACP methyl ester carboxylesterase